MYRRLKTQDRPTFKNRSEKRIPFLFLSLLLLLWQGIAFAAENPTVVAAIPEKTADHEMTLEHIADQLNQHLASVADVSAQVTFVQVSSRDGSKNEGKLQLAAVFPHLIRATWHQPEIYSGVFFILDSHQNTYTEYVPATGEAHRLPLDQVLDENSPIPLTPHQLFMLPSADDFDLALESVDTESNDAVVKAIEKKTGRQYLVHVDTERWLVTRVEGYTSDGRLELSAEAHDIKMNQDLSAASLRHLPPGTVERSYR